MAGKKGQLVWDTLVPWIIGIAVLVLMLVLYETIYGKGEGALSYFKNLLRSG
jgi:hypothetical protein